MTYHLFYRPEQSVELLDSYSPSAGKPAAFVERINRTPNDFEPITIEDLLLVHDEAYVRGVFDGTRLNGFENRDPRVAQACLYTIGSLLAAARAAIDFPCTPVCSPSSGFHHAGFNEGGGYCTFNGLMVVAAKLLQEDPSARIAILDCDVHYGDGIDDILKHRPQMIESVLHLSAGKQVNQDRGARAFLQWLDRAIEAINQWQPTVVLYQAGADMHVDDPLGGVLSSSEMRHRDLAVFERVAAPIAWNLAGGYQRPLDKVLDLHERTFVDSEKSIPLRQKLLVPAHVRQAFERWARLHAIEPTSQGAYPRTAWSAFAAAALLMQRSRKA